MGWEHRPVCKVACVQGQWGDLPSLHRRSIHSQEVLGQVLQEVGAQPLPGCSSPLPGSLAACVGCLPPSQLPCFPRGLCCLRVSGQRGRDLGAGLSGPLGPLGRAVEGRGQEQP